MASFGMSWGRKTWIVLGNMIEIVGTIISVTSYEPGQLIVGRVLIVSEGKLRTISYVN